MVAGEHPSGQLWIILLMKKAQPLAGLRFYQPVSGSHCILPRLLLEYHSFPVQRLFPRFRCRRGHTQAPGAIACAIRHGRCKIPLLQSFRKSQGFVYRIMSVRGLSADIAASIFL